MNKYEIFNVHCNNCVNKIKNALGSEFGEVKFSEDLKYIFVNATKEEIEDILEELGFKLGKMI